MKVVMKGWGFFLLLVLSLGPTTAALAQAPEATSRDSQEAGSFIVFPKFIKGTVTADGSTKPQTEIEIQARCPRGATCVDNEPVKIRFHWVCPGTEDISSKYICKEASFDFLLPVDGNASFNLEDSQPPGSNSASVAPCPSGYLIGWVIDSKTDRPIKFDGLTGRAVLRHSRGPTEEYEAIAIQADPNLATRAAISTEIDPRSGTPALVFDGGAGHYQAVADGIPATLDFRKLPGPLSSSEASLILLTLDVRLNRPNYPTFIDLDYRSEQGIRASTSQDLMCWKEIQNPNIDAYFTLVGARTRKGIVLSGQAMKVPFGGVSDIPGPVTLLGLAPADEGGPRRSMDPVYVVRKADGGKAPTVLVPYD